MNKVYKDIDEYLRETFPNYFNKESQKDETTIQNYIDKTSQEFSSEINKIIKGQNLV